MGQKQDRIWDTNTAGPEQADTLGNFSRCNLSGAIAWIIGAYRGMVSGHRGEKPQRGTVTPSMGCLLPGRWAGLVCSIPVQLIHSFNSGC